MAPEGLPSNADAASDQEAEASRLVRAKKYDAALISPPDFSKPMEAYRKAIHDDAAAKQGAGSGAGGAPRSGSGSKGTGERGAWRERVAGGGIWLPGPIPRPKIIYTTANERSRWPTAG